MAGATGDWSAGAVDLRNVAGVDVFDHLVHLASGLFLFLGIVGKVELGLAIGSQFF